MATQFCDEGYLATPNRLKAVWAPGRAAKPIRRSSVRPRQRYSGDCDISSCVAVIPRDGRVRCRSCCGANLSVGFADRARA